jgi:prefoldin subunit 5
MKMENINERIQKVKYEIQEKKRINRLLNNSLSQREELKIKVKKLEKQLKKEVNDVDKLKGMSFQNFLHIIIGDKDEKMKKENGEMLSAKLKYDSTLNELNSLEETIKKLNNEINRFGNLEMKYDYILKKKEEWICNNNFSNAAELFKIVEEKSQIKAELKELEEALNAGNKVIYAIEQVESSLDSAEGWGTWDMLGGGLLSTMQKHSYMDEAQTKIEEVQNKLLIYNRELKDIGTTFSADISLDSFTSFADYFFDGLFVDWSVQSKIHEAQQSVSKFKDRIISLNRNINNKIDLLSQDIDKLEQKRIRVIEVI